MTTLTYGFKRPATGDQGSVWFPAMEDNITRLDAHDHDGTDSAQLTNSAIAAGAAIAYSKLNLSGSIVNADVSNSAAIAYSKLNLTGAILNADLAGSIAASKLVGTDIATVGTITTGTWSATAIAVNKGGTNITSYTAGDILYATGATTLAKLGIGTAGQVLRTNGGATAPEWATITTPLAVAAKTADYTLTANDDFITVDSDADANGFTITLPDNAANTGKIYRIKRIGTTFATARAVTIARAGSDTITDATSGLTSTALHTPGEEIEIVSMGTGVWQVIDRRIPSVWTSFTPTGGWSTNTTYNAGFWRRVGDSIEFTARLTLSGAPDGASLTWNLPSGLTIDTGKLTGTSANQDLGMCTIRDGGTETYAGRLYYSTTTALISRVLINGASGVTIDQAVDNTVPHTFANTDEVFMRSVCIPIVGWNG